MDEEVRASYEAQLAEACAVVQEVSRQEDEVLDAIKTVYDLNATLGAIVARQEEILKEMNTLHGETSALLNEIRG